MQIATGSSKNMKPRHLSFPATSRHVSELIGNALQQDDLQDHRLNDGAQLSDG